MSSIFGSGELFDAAAVRRLYPGGAADYLERFTASLDSAIQSGFLLAADREEILELAAATCSLTSAIDPRSDAANHSGEASRVRLNKA